MIRPYCRSGISGLSMGLTLSVLQLTCHVSRTRHAVGQRDVLRASRGAGRIGMPYCRHIRWVRRLTHDSHVMNDCSWPNPVGYDQQLGQPQPARAVSSTGIRILGMDARGFKNRVDLDRAATRKSELHLCGRDVFTTLSTQLVQRGDLAAAWILALCLRH